MPLEVWWYSDVGLVRGRNEDALSVGDKAIQESHIAVSTAIVPWPALLSVVDGMGGHDDGHVAAFATVNLISSLRPSGAPSDVLRNSMHLGNDIVTSRGTGSDRNAPMGAVIVAAIASSESVCIANVGDATAFIHSHGLLSKVSTDDVGIGGAVTQCLGGTKHFTPVEPHIRTIGFGPSTRILLATDGLTGTAEFETIQSALTEPSLEDAAQRLIDAAFEEGARDNVTFLLAQHSSD